MIDSKGDRPRMISPRVIDKWWLDQRVMTKDDRSEGDWERMIGPKGDR